MDFLLVLIVTLISCKWNFDTYTYAKYPELLRKARFKPTTIRLIAQRFGH